MLQIKIIIWNVLLNHISVLDLVLFKVFTPFSFHMNEALKAMF